LQTKTRINADNEVDILPVCALRTPMFILLVYSLVCDDRAI